MNTDEEHRRHKESNPSYELGCFLEIMKARNLFDLKKSEM